MFKHFDIQIPNPDFKDPIVKMIIELEKLRGNDLHVSINTKIFNQLKNVFHILESLYSARIEGNRTTINDYVQDKAEGKTNTQNFKEISNIEDAMKIIDDLFLENKNNEINFSLLSNLHKILTKDLDPSHEGSRNPGVYRLNEVAIKNAKFTPPINIKVPEYMENLISFINNPVSLQDELLKVAIAHHRFVWIHPFDNGNGRMSRVLTYAMLKKANFDKISFLNMAAVFCINRDQYFDKLGKADTGSEENLLDWCRFVLSGLLSELKKLRNLLNADFLINNIFKPTIEYALANNMITNEEYGILLLSINKEDNLIMAKDISEKYPEKSTRQITYILNKMIEKGILQKESDNSRKYLINIMQKGLLRGIIENLSKNGFTKQLDN